MPITYPDWASKKQRKGMKKFYDIATEYGNFEIEFNKSVYDREKKGGFAAVLKWETLSCKSGLGTREHKFEIAFDYERTWNCYGERVYQWQFVFSGGDATREMTTEVLFLDLFFYLDGIAVTEVNP